MVYQFFIAINSFKNQESAGFKAFQPEPVAHADADQCFSVKIIPFTQSQL
jgi:hypothetical protein